MYTAIIIEFRRHNAFNYVLHNFTENLSDDWGVIVFHGNLNGDFVKQGRYTKHIKYVHLPYDNLMPSEYSRLLISPGIIYPEIPTETFLIFQTDSIIIKKNKDYINDFLNYDYVGAPWTNYECGNGGLSLRKKSKMLEIIEKEHPQRRELPEDLFFAMAEQVTIYKPDWLTASRFSIEDVLGCGDSFGCHKAWNHQIDFCCRHEEIRTLIRLQN